MQPTMKGESSRKNNMENNHSSALPREPTLQFLQGITKNFSTEREIGRGAFGVVYKVWFHLLFSDFFEVNYH